MGVMLLVTHSKAQCTLACKPGPIEIALGSEGFAVLFPEYFIAFESQDCTGLNRVEIEETGSDTVFCFMLESDYTIRVTNLNSGNFCRVGIRVVDNLLPQWSCPDDVTLQCDQDFEDLGLTGEPNVIDNCDYSLTHSDDLNDLNACGYGEVLRNWVLEDQMGRIFTCTQVIHVVDTIEPSIQFPADITIFCGDNKDDLSLTGRPDFSDNCGSLDDSYTDLEFDLCGGQTKRVLRNWSVVDFCDPNGPYGIYRFAQTIEIRDTVKPIWLCPAWDTLPTDPFTDTHSYTLAEPDSLYDACSGVYWSAMLITARGDTSITDSMAEFDLSVGENRILHFVTDSCGNKDSCIQRMSIVDEEEPIIVCFPTLNIALGTDSTRLVPRQFYRDISDNVTPDSLLDLRLGRNGIFSDELWLNCSDLDSGLMTVTLKAQDAAGNINYCDVDVELADVSPPVIVCPSDLSLGCATSLDSLPSPQVYDNCHANLSYQDDLSGLNNCGYGIVERTWTAIDGSGLTDACTQRIELLFTGQPSYSIPQDITIACGDDIRPGNTGEPIILNDCSELVYSYNDQVFTGGPDFVEIIRRSFEISDLCRPNFSEVLIQRISVEDNSTPSLNCNHFDFYYLDHDSCDIEVEISLGTADNCSTEFFFSHTADRGEIVDGTYRGEFEVGNHIFSIKVEDASGNFDQCFIEFEIVDTIPPVPLCRNGLSFGMNESGFIQPNPILFDLGSYDNCTDVSSLNYRIEPSSFDCFDHGINPVSFIVSDAYGNETVCTTEVVITDPQQYCPPIEQGVGGFLIDPAEFREVSQLPVRVIYLADTSIVYTDDKGYYQLEGIPRGNPVEIEPIQLGDFSQGLTTRDIVLLRQHLLEYALFTEPRQYLAADVNNSGSITNLDLLFIRGAILRTVAGFPGGDGMRSIRYDEELSQPDEVLEYTSEDEMYLLDSLLEDAKDLHFFVTKKGDVNGDAFEMQWAQSRVDCDSAFVFLTDSRCAEPGEIVTLTLSTYVDVDLLGMQFALNFDRNKLRFLDVRDLGNIGLSNGNYNVLQDPARFILSWDRSQAIALSPDEEILEIRFEVIDKTDWPDCVSLSESIPPEIIDADFNAYDICDDQLNDLEEELSAETMDVSLFPNPVRSQLTIRPNYLLHHSGYFYVTDISGRIHKKIILNPGQLIYNVDIQHFKPGVYLLFSDDTVHSTWRKLGKFVKIHD